MLRTSQAQIAKKLKTFSSGSASAKKFDVLIEKKSICESLSSLMGDGREGWSGGGRERGEGVFGVCIVGLARLCVPYHQSTLKCFNPTY